MRWQLLFDELEYGFDELLRQRSGQGGGLAEPASALSAYPAVTSLCVRAKAAREPIRVVLTNGWEGQLLPRAVGRDWVSGADPASTSERIIALSAICAATGPSAEVSADIEPTPATLHAVLQLWKQREQPLVVATARHRFQGQLDEVVSDAITVATQSVARPVTWTIPLEAIVSVESVDSEWEV